VTVASFGPTARRLAREAREAASTARGSAFILEGGDPDSDEARRFQDAARLFDQAAAALATHRERTTVGQR